MFLENLSSKRFGSRERRSLSPQRLPKTSRSFCEALCLDRPKNNQNLGKSWETFKPYRNVFEIFRYCKLIGPCINTISHPIFHLIFLIQNPSKTLNAIKPIENPIASIDQFSWNWLYLDLAQRRDRAVPLDFCRVSRVLMIFLNSGYFSVDRGTEPHKNF